MEIKILCHCGTKFKFDWESTRDGLPSRINCPGCGADVTLEARQIIQHQATPAVPPAPALPPPLPALVPPVPPAPPVTIAPSVTVRPVVRRTRDGDGEDSRRTKLIVVSVLLVVFVVGGFGVWKVGQKMFAAIESAREIAGMVGDDSGINADINLTAMDEVILYVKHANYLEVAQACTDYWQTALRRNLTIIPYSEDDEGQEGDAILQPAYHGYVRITGPLEWPESHFEGLAKFLSSRLNTLVFEERDVDFTSAFHFGVYENGERRFHAQMDIVGNSFEEKVTVENENWALQNGFKPGDTGFTEFNINDADEITKHLGLKLWDEPETDEPPRHLLLRETR